MTRVANQKPEFKPRRMQALLPPASPLFASAASMQEAAAAANAAAHQQLNAAALATMLVHGPPGQPYAPGALAQLLAFTTGQTSWQVQAQALAANSQQPFADAGRGGASAPASGEERAGKTTNYAARHQAAEKRRRNRINDRLAALRDITPIAPSCNTAEFLIELHSYVITLQSLAGVAPKQPLVACAAGTEAAGAGAVEAPLVALEAPLLAAGADEPADSEEELSEEAPAAAPAKRRRGAART